MDADGSSNSNLYFLGDRMKLCREVHKKYQLFLELILNIKICLRWLKEELFT